MATDVKVNFRVTGAADLARAFDTITGRAQRSAAAAARAQVTGSTAATTAAKRAKNEMLSDAEALANAEIALIRKVNRARTEAAREQVKLQAEAQSQLDRMTAAQERAARASNRRRAAGEIGSGAAAGFKKGVGTLAGVGGVVTGAIGMAGIQKAVEERLAVGKMNAQLAADVNESGKTPLDQKKMLEMQQRVARNTGISVVDVAEAMSTAAGEGGGLKGLEVFNASIDKMGEISIASGSKMADIAKLSATLTNNMVTDPDEQVSVITNMLGAAKKNNVNLRDEAERVMTIAGAHMASGFVGTGTNRVEQSAGLMQLAKMGGSANREDAATAARNFYNDIASKEANLRKLGVQTIDKKSGKRTDAVEQFIQLFEKTKGDITKIDPQFGSQSASVVGSLSAAYRGENKDLRGADGKVLRGREAVERLLKESTTGGMSYADVQKDASIVKADTSNQMARAMEDFKAKVGNDLLPILSANVANFGKLAEGVAKATAVFAEHPGKVAAGFVAITTAMGAAEVVLGRAGTALLDKMFSGKAVGTMTVTAGNVVVGGPGAGGPPAPGGGAGAGAGAGAAAGTSTAGMVAGGVVAGVLGAVAGSMIADDIGSKADKQRKGLDANIADATNLSTRIRQGAATPEEIARAKALEGSLSAEGNKGFFGRFADGATAGVKGLAGGEASLANLLSVLPPVALLRGAMEGGLGGSGKDAAGAASAELREALKSVEMRPGSKVGIDNAAEVGAAMAGPVSNAVRDGIAAAGLQGPKAQTE